MKAFKKDFDGEKFIKISFDIAHEYDFSKDPDTMLADNHGCHNCHEVIVDETIEKLNNNLVDTLTENSNHDSIMVKKCKECGKYFIIGYDDFMWFKHRDLSIPSRCRTCRKSRRVKK